MSLEIKIKVKNYRCFADSNPLEFSVIEGAIAFIGANNAGKSAALRFFYEIKSLWGQLIQPTERIGDGLLSILAPGNPSQGIFSFSLNQVPDPEDVFCNLNNRPITIELEITKTVLRKASYVKSITISIPRPFSNAKVVSIKSDSNQEILLGQTDRADVIYKLRNLYFSDLNNAFSILQNCFYIGAFRNAVTLGSANYFDLKIGTAFIAEWKNNKYGNNKSLMRATVDLETSIKQLFGFSSLQINASNDGNSLVLIIDERPFRLDEVGAGLSHFIIVLVNLLINRPKLVLIDEPEINLHASFQIKFILLVQELSKFAVMFTTHSVGLARSTADLIYSVKKVEHASLAKIWNPTHNLKEMAGELSFSTWPEIGAGKILLVEGTTEVKAIQHFLRLAKKDKDILVIPLGGSSLINGTSGSELQELQRLNAPIHVLIDSEKKAENEELGNDRKAFVEICKALNFQIHVLQRRAFENYLAEHAIKSVCGDKYRSLGAHESLKDSGNGNFLGWSKSDNWRIVMKMSLDDLKGTDLENYFENL